MKAGGSRVQVRVELKPGVVDAEAMAARRALGLLGIKDVESVRISRTYELEFKGVRGPEALRRANESVEKLLANPVIHTVSLSLTKDPAPTSATNPGPRRGQK